MPDRGPDRGHEGVIPLTHAHLDQALGLSQVLNWPYRLEDWKFALELGHGLAVEAEGQLVGTALWWSYGAAFASVGMIIVSPNAQRQGIGARLMAAMLTEAAGRRVILNSTREGEALYTRLGFRPYGAVTQHQAVLASAPPVDPGVPVRSARPEDSCAIKAIDETASGMDRRRMLDALLAIADTVVVERGGEITGYGCVRRWGRGGVIGPVIARDAVDARAIIAALAASHEGDFVRIDVTQKCGLASWLVEIGLPQTDRVISMSLGEPPQAAPGAILFALSNQSLG
ncbi:N-acetyltransferase [Sphingosinicella microcystinivorans]|uniref:N-acetyltransferase n=2 Tax=Sphingosinicella microcystinivorans TaxID=335406 RepID=A0AAD1D5R4_SPHMI|nr:N-acetyltransferase [Sphingosinicella microcystinivorans]